MEKNRSQIWYENNKEYALEYATNYRKEGKKILSIKDKERYKTNRDYFINKALEYQKNNKEKIKEYNRQYYIKKKLEKNG